MDAAAEVPKREPLGPLFQRLFGAAITSNLADGLARTSVPLLAATVTDDPFAFSVVGALAFVPWLLFGIPAGWVVDHVDRRWALAGANTLRLIGLAGLAAAIASGMLDLWLLYIAAFVIGLGETVADNAANALVPATVTPRQLDRANGRMMLAQISIDSFVATPIAGLLFAVAIVVPFVSAAAGYAVAIGFVLLLPRAVGRAFATPAPLGAEVAAEAEAREHPGTSVRYALRFLVRHPYLGWMTVVVSLLGFFLTFAQAATVLFFLDTLDVPIAAVGLVTAGIGAGALVGSIVAAGLVERFGRGAVMFWAALTAGVTLGLTGLAPTVWVAVPIYALSAFAVSIWNVPWGAIRQELTPAPILGTVIGAIRTVGWGLFPVATLLGGLVARLDLRVPFYIGGALTVVLVIVSARMLLSATRVTAAHRALEH